METTPQLTTRNASLAELAQLLRDQHAAKTDIVAPAAAIRADGARLVVAGADPVLSEDGVTMTAGTYTPTDVCDGGLADKLGIPSAYLRRLRSQRPGLYDANVNGWLENDTRRFLIRGLRGQLGGGIARAFLSDGYKIIDNLDVLMAALDGVRQAGIGAQIDGCDLTERRMYVRVVAEQVQALAPQLLAGYRSPFTGAVGADNPVVFAGFMITNSETGCGAFSLIPRLVVQVCRNGMTITRDALREVHLGGRLDEGIIHWSGDTQDKSLALVQAKTRDAVATFLDTGYVTQALSAIEEAAAAPVTSPETAVRTVASRLRFTDDQADDILRHFIEGGQCTAGGIMQAVTATAQTVPNADTAHAMEAQAMRALEVAATL
jgi:hypothetical protein